MTALLPTALLPQSSRRTSGRTKGGRIGASRQAIWQAFPNLACFAPNISKESFGGFVRFQGVTSPKNLNDVPPNFFVAPASLQPCSRRLRAAFRHSRATRVRTRTAVRVILRCRLVSDAFMAEQA